MADFVVIGHHYCHYYYVSVINETRELLSGMCVQNGIP